MSDIQEPKSGEKEIGFSAEDDCGNKTRGTRMIQIIQNLIEGRYVNITESGDTATISVDPSSDYYNKYEINELLGNLGTVQFKIVATLPAVGASNVIYLVAKTAPEVGYDQYIWNTEDMQFFPIGDTDIDLSDYYTKLQTYAKTEADAKFQEKLTAGANIDPVTDATTVSQVNLSDKTVKQVTGYTLWEYVKNKITGSASSVITTNLERSKAVVTDANQKLNVSGVYSAELEQLSGINTTKTVQTQLNEKQTAFEEAGEITILQDTIPLARVNLSTNKVSPIPASTVWSYIKSKIAGAISTVIDTNLDTRKAVVTDVNGKLSPGGATSTEVGYLSGVTSKIQDQIDAKQKKDWTYVGILSAARGSAITVGDDWDELDIIMRISEGSSHFNITNIKTKNDFTYGSPTENATFVGFNWSTSFRCVARVGLSGSGTSRKLTLNWDDATGWAASGYYILKR